MSTIENELRELLMELQRVLTSASPDLAYKINKFMDRWEDEDLFKPESDIVALERRVTDLETELKEANQEVDLWKEKTVTQKRRVDEAERERDEGRVREDMQDAETRSCLEVLSEVRDELARANSRTRLAEMAVKANQSALASSNALLNSWLLSVPPLRGARPVAETRAHLSAHPAALAQHEMTEDEYYVYQPGTMTHPKQSQADSVEHSCPSCGDGILVPRLTLTEAEQRVLDAAGAIHPRALVRPLQYTGDWEDFVDAELARRGVK